jgi:hypothetical protein
MDPHPALPAHWEARSRTVVARNNPAVPSMIRKVGRIGDVGGMHSTGKGLVVPAVPIVFSDTPFQVPVLVSPEAPRCWQGAIGADLLRHCTLVWGWSSLWAACRSPAG